MIFEQNRHRSRADVLDEARKVLPQLLQGLEALSEEDLHDPARFPHMPLDWKPWKLIAENTFEHYREHMSGIRAWRDAPEGR